MEDKNRRLTCKDKCVDIVIQLGKRINILNYNSRPVLYTFILPLTTKDNRIVVKIGYTSNILSRIRSLGLEFNCSKIFLIGIRLVRDRNDYKTFNKILTNKFKHQREKVIIDGIKKSGTYWLSESLMDEFDAINFVEDEHLPVNCYDDVMEVFAQKRLQGFNLDDQERECLITETVDIVRHYQKMANWIDVRRREKESVQKT